MSSFIGRFVAIDMGASAQGNNSFGLGVADIQAAANTAGAVVCSVFLDQSVLDCNLITVTSPVAHHSNRAAAFFGLIAIELAPVQRDIHNAVAVAEPERATESA